MKLKRRFGVVLLMAMLVMAMTVTASAAKKVKLNKKSATLSIGKTVTLRVKNAGKKKVTWASSDVYVATVDDGVVTAVDAGTATIRATVGAKTLKCKVTVKAAAEQASVQFARYSTFEPRLTLDGSAYGNNLNTTDTKVTDALRGSTVYDLKPHVDVTPANATLTWTSSNEKVATVKDGVVTAVANGTAKITASANGASDSIVVFVTGMGSDEDSNPVVITSANYDRLFNKFFEKVKVTTVWLDVNGNIMNPSTLKEAWVVNSDGKTKTDITDHVRKDFIEEKYYFVVKDPRVDFLKSSGSGILKYWVTWNKLTANGGNPVLTPTNDKFAWTNNQNMYEWYEDKITGIRDFVFDKAGNIPFKYTYEVYDADKNDKVTLEAAGLCKVIVSDPAVAGKAVKGFQYGLTNDKLTPVFDAPRDKNGKMTGPGTYYMWSYEDEVFTACQFTLYLK